MVAMSAFGRNGRQLAVETVDLLFARQLLLFDGALLARLEAHGGPRGDVQAHAVGAPALETERRIDLEKVEVRADLDRPVAAIVHHHGGCLTAVVDADLALFEDVFAWDHDALLVNSVL